MPRARRMDVASFLDIREKPLGLFDYLSLRLLSSSRC